MSFVSVTLPLLKWRPSPNYSRRHESIRLVVIHDTEGGYEGSVSWLCNPRSQASAHVVLREDGNEATQLVRFSDKAWHCMGYNSAGLGLEIAGFANKPYPSKQLRRAARITAFWLRKYGLPPTHVKPRNPGLIDHTIKGFTYHSDLGSAGGGHHDPGFNTATRLYFDNLVKLEYRLGKFRPSWGRS